MAPVNTQFSIAVHLLLGIAKLGSVNSKAMADSVNTSSIFLKRILSKLSKAGLIATSKGRSGGSTLARAANKITLFDVYMAVEFPKAFAVHDYQKVSTCDVSSAIQDTMCGVLKDVQTAIEKELKSKTIADLLKEMKIKA
jgi:Rrf2 family protein